MQDSEGPSDDPTPIMIQVNNSTDISGRGRVRMMNCAMPEHMFQWSFYGDCKMQYMANKAKVSISKDTETQFIWAVKDHLSSQKCMRYPIAFHIRPFNNLMLDSSWDEGPDQGTNWTHRAQEMEDDQVLTTSKDVDVIPSVWSMW
jgi:hypothetical protein